MWVEREFVLPLPDLLQPALMTCKGILVVWFLCTEESNLLSDGEYIPIKLWRGICSKVNIYSALIKIPRFVWNMNVH
jgi:hypothetical protein